MKYLITITLSIILALNLISCVKDAEAATSYVKKDDYTVEQVTTVPTKITKADFTKGQIANELARLERQKTEAQQRLDAINADIAKMTTANNLIVVKPKPKEIKEVPVV